MSLLSWFYSLHSSLQSFWVETINIFHTKYLYYFHDIGSLHYLSPHLTSIRFFPFITLCGFPQPFRGQNRCLFVWMQFNSGRHSAETRIRRYYSRNICNSTKIWRWLSLSRPEFTVKAQERKMMKLFFTPGNFIIQSLEKLFKR